MSNPRDFMVERDYTDVPVEDYNEGKDYSFGMKRAIRVIAYTVMGAVAASCVVLLFVGYFG